MVIQHHCLNRHEFEQIWGDSEGQVSLACGSPWCCRLGQDLVTKQQDQKRQGEGEVTRTGRVHSSSYGCPWKRGPQLNVQPMREECTHWQPKSEMRELVENTLFPLCPLSPFLPASFLSSGIPYLFIPLLQPNPLETSWQRFQLQFIEVRFRNSKQNGKGCGVAKGECDNHLKKH